MTEKHRAEYNDLVTDISDEEEQVVKDMVSNEFYLYAGKKTVQICPYQSDYVYYVKILNDKGDCDVIGKRLPPERARKK